MIHHKSKISKEKSDSLQNLFLDLFILIVLKLYMDKKPFS